MPFSFGLSTQEQTGPKCLENHTSIADLKHLNKEKPSRIEGLDKVSKHGQAWTSRLRELGGSFGTC